MPSERTESKLVVIMWRQLAQISRRNMARPSGDTGVPLNVLCQYWPAGSRLRRINALIASLCLFCAVASVPSAGSPQVNSISNSSQKQQQQEQQNLQLISDWLKLSLNHRRDGSAPPASGVAVEVSPPPSNMLFQYQPAASRRSLQQQQQQQASSHLPAGATNRSTRTVNGVAAAELAADEVDTDQFNLFVSNICERDFMLVRVRTSRPFYGVIHTLNYRRKSQCSVEGDGATEYQLNISHALDSRDPAHCGVIKLRKQNEREPGAGELLSVVLAIRTRRNVELSDDKFLVLNCTNRCRLLDCSSTSPQPSRQYGQLEYPIKQRQLEKEFDEVATTSQDQTSWWARSAKRASGQSREAGNQTAGQNVACSVWQFPWLIALVCCLAILLAGSAISNCIICLSMSARSPPATVKQRPPASHSSYPQRADDNVGRRGQRERVHGQKYINYDNSEYYRPVDVAHLQATGRPRRTGLGGAGSRHDASNGSHDPRTQTGGKQAAPK